MSNRLAAHTGLLLTVIGIYANFAALGQQRVPQTIKVAAIKDPTVMQDCGCSFRTARNTKDMFLADLEEKNAWMNIDGRDVKLTLVKESGFSMSQPGRDPKRGSKAMRLYRAGGTTVRVDYVATKVCAENDESCESTQMSATYTIEKDGKTQIVKASGACGC